jgi:hypothetical protein
LAGPRKRFVALAQKGVLDGVLDVVIVRHVPFDLMKNEVTRKKGKRALREVRLP